MDMNTLSQWMDFAKQNNLFPDPNRFSSGSGFQPTQFNTNLMAANWARGMAGPSSGGGQPKDFFANFSQTPAPGVQIGENPYSARAQQLGNSPYAGVPLAAQTQNYLSRLLQK